MYAYNVEQKKYFWIFIMFKEFLKNKKNCQKEAKYTFAPYKQHVLNIPIFG